MADFAKCQTLSNLDGERSGVAPCEPGRDDAVHTRHSEAASLPIKESPELMDL